MLKAQCQPWKVGALVAAHGASSPEFDRRARAFLYLRAAR